MPLKNWSIYYYYPNIWCAIICCYPSICCATIYYYPPIYWLSTFRFFKSNFPFWNSWTRIFFSIFSLSSNTIFLWIFFWLV